MEKTKSVNKNQGIMFAIVLSLFAVSLSALSIIFNPGSAKRLLMLPITSNPIPSPVCKKGVNNFAYSDYCAQNSDKNHSYYKSAKYDCYDGTRGTLNSASCKEPYEFRNSANYACERLSNVYCQPVPTQAPKSPFGKAAKFTGQEAIVYNPSTKEFNLKAPFTFEAWVKPEPPNIKPNEINNYFLLAIASTIVPSKIDKCDANFSMDLAYDPKSDKYSVNGHVGAAGYSYQVGDFTSGDISSNQWSHLALSYGSDNLLRLFINGKLNDSVYVNKLKCSTMTSVVIGSETNDLLKSTNVGFLGEIDEVRVSNSSRYNSNFSVPQKPFISDQQTPFLWHLNGNTVNSGNLPYNVVILGSLKYVDSTVPFVSQITPTLSPGWPTGYPSPIASPTPTIPPPRQCITTGEGGCLTNNDCCPGLTCDLSSSAMYGTCKYK